MSTSMIRVFLQYKISSNSIHSFVILSFGIFWTGSQEFGKKFNVKVKDKGFSSIQDELKFDTFICDLEFWYVLVK